MELTNSCSNGEGNDEGNSNGSVSPGDVESSWEKELSMSNENETRVLT